MSIEKTGIREPILLGNDGRVWDGHHRITAAHQLGIEEVPIKHVGGNDAA
jgi:ParB-like chromosome segregation protein Spo0J